MHEDNLKRLVAQLPFATMKTGVGTAILLPRREGLAPAHPCRPDNAQLLSSFGAFGSSFIYLFFEEPTIYTNGWII
jgi:hypothetical protein